MEYDFNGKKFTLKKATYFLEAKAKEAAGISDRNSLNVNKIKNQYDHLIVELANENDQTKKNLINKKIDSLLEEMIKISSDVWYEDFEKSKNVLCILLNGDVSSLTGDDFGKFDARTVWQDFFTDPSEKRKD